MAVLTDGYGEPDRNKNRTPVVKKKDISNSDRLYRISGSIVVGSKHTSFAKEVRAQTKSDALEKAFKELKDQFKVEVYQILVNTVKEGSSL